MDLSKAVYQLQKIKSLTPNTPLRLAAEWPKKWQILIATILSAQTRDEVTILVCEDLFKKYQGMKRLARAKPSDVEKIIRPVNYHKTKAKRIIETSKILQNKSIPKTLEELIKLPGVGRKVANVYLAEAHKADAIGVDTHVARISQKLGWTKNKDPHKIEKDLEKLFPREYWGKINDTLVRFGKTVGTSRAREDEVIEGVKMMEL